MDEDARNTIEKVEEARRLEGTWGWVMIVN
jgi:hypothetical protein